MVTNTETNSNVSTLTLIVESYESDQFSLFQNEKGGGISISQSEVLQLSEIYSKLYQIYIDRLVERLAKTLNESNLVLHILSRRALVPLIHCFFERLIRVKKAIDMSPVQLVIPNQLEVSAMDTIEAFEQAAVDNPIFNQSMINIVSHAWELPETDIEIEPKIYKPQVGFKNNLFRLYGRTPYRLLKRILLPYFTKLPFSRFPTITLANAQGAFFERGFFIRLLEDVAPQWSLIKANKDLSLRDKLFRNDFCRCSELESFLNKLGLNQKEQDRVYKLFEEYLHTYYPSSLLESIPENMEYAKKSLIKFRKKVLLSSSGRCSRSAYIVAAAKEKDFLIVDHQHGGHYGYLEDVSVILELEYPGVDQFISWGWSKLSDKTPNKNMQVIPLPSPWLSERKRYWRKLKIEGVKEFDILLMPNMVKRFTGAPQGASSSRIDLIQEMSASLIALIQHTSTNGINVLNKPYNTTTVGLLSKTLKEMKSIGGSLYSSEIQLDKGLTYGLLKRCHIVVWDQPGTGFLECISSGIPTMILWPRNYCQEEEWVKPIFNELESCGIVHRHAETLTDQIIQFKKSPIGWMNNIERKNIVDRFCRKFAWASDDWPFYWKRYLENLKVHDEVKQ